ncbi:MAG: hypothetical protein GX795_06800 [Firmicutes bacterium]|nr:hypothetical protein [Bacillota bacterium]
MRINGGEFGLIERIRQWIDAGDTGGAGVVLGIGDDAAVILPPRGKLLAACDMLVEGVHFEREYISPWQLGWKALAVNISDIAAMGGVPLFALTSMGLAGWADDAYVEGVYKGILDIARQFGVQLVGGDIVSSPKAMVLNIAILGSADSPVTRLGPAPGHLTAVTGPLGRSAAGLASLRKLGRKDGPTRIYSEAARQAAQRIGQAGVQPGQSEHPVQPSRSPQSGQSGESPQSGQPEQRVQPEQPGMQARPSPDLAGAGASSPNLESGTDWIDELIKAHLEPVPRVREGCVLASTGVVSAMMDISDGLAGDIHHIARESKVGAAIREAVVPIGESTLLAAKLLGCDPLEWALSGGEDFELVFTFPPEFADTVRDALSNVGGTMHIVGHITLETEGVVLVGSDGAKRTLVTRGYDHFGAPFSP